MGRVNDALEANQTPTIKHFSHPHALELCNNLQNLSQISICSCCKLHSSESIYICRPCNFTLHSSCSQFPQLITHPCHPNHTLALLAISSYPGGKFNCDACNRPGNGFSYHCNVCEFDLHVGCASKPLRITHQFHSCQLELTFVNPYNNTNRFSCDVCSKMGSKQWLYRCSRCEFDVHLDCADARMVPGTRIEAPGMIQRPNSFPGTNPGNLFQAPVGGAQGVQNPVAAGEVYGFVRPYPNLANGSPMPVSSNYQLQIVQNNQVSRTDSLADAAMQGLVGGAAQTVGQTLIQGIIGGEGGDNGGGGVDNGGGGGGGPVVLGNIYVDSEEENF